MGGGDGVSLASSDSNFVLVTNPDTAGVAEGFFDGVPRAGDSENAVKVVTGTVERLADQFQGLINSASGENGAEAVGAGFVSKAVPARIAGLYKTAAFAIGFTAFAVGLAYSNLEMIVGWALGSSGADLSTERVERDPNDATTNNANEVVIKALNPADQQAYIDARVEAHKRDN